MGSLKTLAGNISLNKLLSSYDLIVIPSSPNMKVFNGVSKIILQSVGFKKIEKYIDYKYKSDNYMKKGDIRITPGFNLKRDIMFVRFPINENSNSLKELLNTIKEILFLINLNGYSNILITDLNLSLNGFNPKKNMKKIYEILKEFAIKKDKNIDIYFLTRN